MEQQQQELDLGLPVHFGKEEIQDNTLLNLKEVEEGVDEFKGAAEDIRELHGDTEVESIWCKVQVVEHPRLINLELLYQEAQTF